MSDNRNAVLVDWGTSSFRLWLVDRAGRIAGRRTSNEGMRVAVEKGFDGILESHLAALGAPADAPAIVCGMAGAKGAWAEAGYIDLPADLAGVAQRAISVPGASRNVFILPGLAKRDPAVADVIRGEETMMLGASLITGGAGERLYCQPGTHSKWISMTGSTVSDFRTYMTGELFDAISNHTIISQSVESADAEPSFAADGPFGDAVRAASAQPERFTNLLFGIRGSAILFGAGTDKSRETLSGLLIGMELAGELKQRRNDVPVDLIASGVLRKCYEAAFTALGVSYRTHDAEELVLAGLGRAAQTLGLLDAAPQS
jgi:2-dehydro-3-deoxygalactonokinase